ncbi:hypothetical protein LPJGGPFB_04040 [Ensifer adhaerens]|nr:hypothetical protein [Ensifer adhaerens]
MLPRRFHTSLLDFLGYFAGTIRRRPMATCAGINVVTP